MPQPKFAYAVDHRFARISLDSSLVTFIFPDREEELEKGFLTAGRFGGDFGELRALEQSILDPDMGYGGVLHYRRAFHIGLQDLANGPYRRTLDGYFVPSWNWHGAEEFGWTAQNLERLAKSESVVLPQKLDVRLMGAENLFDQFIAGHPIEILNELQSKWSDAPMFFDFMKKEHLLVAFNMLLSPRHVRLELFNWLIPILNLLEENLAHLSNDPIQRRWPGFIAERLSAYYWHKNESKLDLTYAPVIRLDEALVIDSQINEPHSSFRAQSNSQVLTIGYELNLFFEATKSKSEILSIQLIEAELRVQELELRVQELELRVQELENSASWKVTRPFRLALGYIQRLSMGLLNNRFAYKIKKVLRAYSSGG